MTRLHPDDIAAIAAAVAKRRAEPANDDEQPIDEAAIRDRAHRAADRMRRARNR